MTGEEQVSPEAQQRQGETAFERQAEQPGATPY